MTYETSKAAEKVRARAAESLDTAASAVDSGAASVASAAHSAADALASGARYVREYDLLDLVRRNAGPALLAAVVLGFVVGRTLSRH
jgi:hypothetical protein